MSTNDTHGEIVLSWCYRPLEVPVAQVVIRNLDDAVVERLKARAAARRQSLEQTLREILSEASGPSRAETIEELARWRSLSPPLPDGAPLAEDLIRDDRDGVDDRAGPGGR